jgi:hypothetical protein
MHTLNITNTDVKVVLYETRGASALDFNEGILICIGVSSCSTSVTDTILEDKSVQLRRLGANEQSSFRFDGEVIHDPQGSPIVLREL